MLKHSNTMQDGNCLWKCSLREMQDGNCLWKCSLREGVAHVSSHTISYAVVF